MNHTLPTQNYLNGQFLSEGTGATLAVHHKYTGELLAEVPMASEAQMEQAIVGSALAFQDFRTWSAQKRANHLKKLYALLEKRADEFVHLIVAEAGKPIGYAKGEVKRALTTLELAIHETYRFAGEAVALDFNAGEGKTAFSKRFPIGPIACISPFNFPLNLAMHKIAPALAVGCPFILKPSPFAPLSCLLFAELLDEAGYPAGVANILMADIPVAEMMVRDDRLKMLSFTGSPKVGWHLKDICGRKKVVLELGGNAATVVEETADLEKAAKRIAIGTFLYAGQICISTQRIFVQSSVYERFLPMLLAETEKLKLGDPLDAEVMIGPMISKEHLERVANWVDEAVEGGANILCGAKI